MFDVITVDLDFPSGNMGKVTQIVNLGWDLPREKEKPALGQAERSPQLHMCDSFWARDFEISFWLRFIYEFGVDGLQAGVDNN